MRNPSPSHHTRNFQERSEAHSNVVDSQDLTVRITDTPAPPINYFFHITCNQQGQQWYVREVRAKTASTHDSKQAAVDKAKALASKTMACCIVVHDSNGGFELLDYY